MQQESTTGGPSSRRSSFSNSRRNSLIRETEKKSPLNSATSSASSFPRRNSITRETDRKKPSPISTASSSCTSTPKRQVPKIAPDFMVTGKPLLKKSDRANSLPGYRRTYVDSKKKTIDSHRRTTNHSNSSKSRDTSVEDDMSLDLSQVSDFEDNSPKFGTKDQIHGKATSTPKFPKLSHRQASLQNRESGKIHGMGRKERSFESTKQCRDSTFSCSKDSLYKTSSSASPYRYSAASVDLDYSSVSPEYSGQSSTELSPRLLDRADLQSTRSQDLNISSGSCCLSSWQECSDSEDTKVEGRQRGEGGEWNAFWHNYNNSLSKVPLKNYYDQCPTPYRTENIDLADLEFPVDTSLVRSPACQSRVNNVIHSAGVSLSARETQTVVKCAHLLGSVLAHAIERTARQSQVNEDEIQNLDAQINKLTQPNETGIENVSPNPELDIKKKTLTLELTEPSAPLEVKEEKTCETVTTQTDISLPNTKSAPRIFESILRQLSRTSIEDSLKVPKANVKEKKEEEKEKKEDNKVDERLVNDKKEDEIQK